MAHAVEELRVTGCELCGVGPEDDCSMECPSRLSPDTIELRRDPSQVADLAHQPTATELQALLGVPEGEQGTRLP